MQTEIVKVTGMTCNGCTSKVAHALNAINGVHEVVVSLSDGEAAVRYDEHLTALDKLKSAVKGAGYGIGAAKSANDHQSREQKSQGHKSQDDKSKGGCCS